MLLGGQNASSPYIVEIQSSRCQFLMVRGKCIPKISWCVLWTKDWVRTRWLFSSRPPTTPKLGRIRLARRVDTNFEAQPAHAHAHASTHSLSRAYWININKYERIHVLIQNNTYKHRQSYEVETERKIARGLSLCHCLCLSRTKMDQQWRIQRHRWIGTCTHSRPENTTRIHAHTGTHRHRHKHRPRQDTDETHLNAEYSDEQDA